MLGLTSFSWPNAQVVHVSPSLGEATRGIKSAHDQERTAAVGWLRRTLRGNAQALAQMEAACAQLAGLYANGTTGGTTVERMRRLIFKQLACSSAAIFLGVGSGHVPATIVTFPFLHFASGHTFLHSHCSCVLASSPWLCTQPSSLATPQVLSANCLPIMLLHHRTPVCDRMPNAEFT